MKINDVQYRTLRPFLRILLNALPNGLGVGDLGDQVDADLLLLESTSLAKARKALGMALADSLQKARGLSKRQIKEIDELLVKSGCSTLSDSLFGYSMDCERLLNSTKIHSESDYFLLKGYLEGEFQILPEAKRSKLIDLVEGYEDRQ